MRDRIVRFLQFFLIINVPLICLVTQLHSIKDVLKIGFYFTVIAALVVAQTVNSAYPRRILLLLLVLTALLPLNIALSAVQIDAKAIPGYWQFSFVQFCILGLLFMKSVNKDHVIYGNMVTNRYCLGLLIFAVIAFSTTMNKNNPNIMATIIGSTYVLSMALLALLLIRKYELEDYLNTLWYAFSLSLLVQTIFVIAFPVLNVEGATMLLSPEGFQQLYRDGGLGRAVGTTDHPNMLAVYLCTLSPFFLACVLHGYKNKLSMVFYLLAVFDILLTQSRNGILVLLLSSVLLINIVKSGNITLKGSLTVLLGVIMLLGLVVFKDELLQGDNLNDMWQARNTHWDIALDLIGKHFWWGIGFNSCTDYLDKFISVSGNELGAAAGFFEMNPIHNAHLLYLAETGVIGYLVLLAIYVGLFVAGTLGVRKNEDFQVKIASSFNLGAAMSIMIFGCFDWAAARPIIWIQLALMIAFKGLVSKKIWLKSS